MRVTCHGCKHLKRHDLRGGAFFGCEATGYVVPHQANMTPGEVTFWRIPLECPLPATEVKKSSKQAKQKEWVTCRIDSISPADGEQP